MPKPQPKFISEYVDWVQQRYESAELFFGHGCENARDEAIWTVLHIMGFMDREFEQIHDYPVTSDDHAAISNLLDERISTRKPLAYLIREAWFAGHTFYIDERAIVPRSHLGDLIRDGFEPWIEPKSVRSILDLCTGSGCIAIALALKFTSSSVTASDVDADALRVAEINVEDFGLEDRVNLIQSDLFSKLQGERYDLIVSNPPYVDAAILDVLPREYQYEPPIAFCADEFGLQFIRKILHQADQYLNDNGFIIIEAGTSTNKLESEYPSIPFFWLTSDSGESVVLIMSREELLEYKPHFSAPLK